MTIPRTLLRLAAASLAALLVLAAPAESFAAKKKKGGGAKGGGAGAPASAAPEGDKEKEARRHFDSGNLFYESGDYLAAAAEFLVAYELVPKASLLYNAGLSYEEAKDAGKALEMYKRYLKTAPDAANRAEVEGRIARLGTSGNRTLTLTSKPEGASVWVDLRAGEGAKTPYTVSLELGAHKLFIEKKGYKTITSEFSVTEDSEGSTVEIELTSVRGRVSVDAPDGADVFVDDEKVGVTPLDPVEVAAGEHAVIVRAPGKAGIARTIDVGEGETVVVRVAGSGSTLTIASLALVGAGVAGGGAVAAVFGVQALSLHGQLRRCADLGICTMGPAETDLAIRRGKTFALIADIAWIGGAVLAGTGIVLLVVGLSGAKSAPARDDYAGAPGLRLEALGVVPLPGGGAVTAAGSF